MKKHIVYVLALCLCLGLAACTSEQNAPALQSQGQKSSVTFDMELGVDAIDGDNSLMRALRYDENNLSAGKYPRFSPENTCTTETFIFEGRRLIGYTVLDWKVEKAQDGKIMLVCKKELPVYSMTEKYGVTTLDRTKTITLSAGKTYKMLGIMGGGVLELGMPTGAYLDRQTYGPRVSFDPKDYAQMYRDGKFQPSEGCVPYVFHRDVSIQMNDNVQVLASANPQMRITPATPVLRFIVKNNTPITLTSDHNIRVEYEGITPKFVLGAMSGPNSPGHRIYRGITTQEESGVTEYKLPIADLAPGETATYFVPIVMVNGDPANVGKISLRVPRDLRSEPDPNSNGTFHYRTNALGATQIPEIYYEETDNAQMSRYWLNAEGRYNMHTIGISVGRDLAIPEF